MAGSGVKRTRMSRTNHPMPMLENPYSGDHSGLRGQKTRDSATLDMHEPRARVKTRPFASSKDKSSEFGPIRKTGSGQYFMTDVPREAEHSVIGGTSWHPEIPETEGKKMKPKKPVPR